MPPSLVDHGLTAGLNGPLTVTLNTTGSNFIVVQLTYYSAAVSPSFADSQGGNSNSYSGLTIYGSAGINIFSQLLYCTPAHVGTSHTFTFSGTTLAGVITVQAWSGMSPSSVFQVGTDNGNFSSGTTTIQPGSISPTGSTLVISGNFGANLPGIAVDSSFTITDSIAYSGGNNFSSALAYLIQSSGSTVNPTWSWDGSTQIAGAEIAAFTSAGAASFQPDEDLWNLQPRPQSFDPSITVFS